MNNTAAPLRQDLHLFDGGSDAHGGPLWTIQDPVRNRFFQIGWLEYECLLRWPAPAEAIAAEINRTTPLRVVSEQVDAFGRFLSQHQLLQVTTDEQRHYLLQQQADAVTPWRNWRWWLHHYLFVRIPLVRPERRLQRLSQILAPLFSPITLWCVLLAGLLGLLLVARQWDSFTHGIVQLLTPAGLLGFLLALGLSKTLHELGHALVATRYGVRVAHMGVALVVLWPMLYTDTGESWRLKSHRQRLMIALAGVTAELMLAAVATLAWALLDDGGLRQAMLYLATTGWVLSLALNISPFMRFDGYFVLADSLNFANLHERAGAQARVWLRRALLGLPVPYPEPFSRRRRRALIGFALLTWCYRLVLFLAIAWAVYLFFFKVLGIVLLVVELGWFIGKPLMAELSVWWRQRHQIRTGRRWLLFVLLLALLLGLVWPWPVDVAAQGVAQPARVHTIYAPQASQIRALHPAGQVEQGQLLVAFAAPDLATRQARYQASIATLQQYLNSLESGPQGLAQRLSTRQRLHQQQAEIDAVQQEQARLQIAAPFDGVWLDLTAGFQPGVWVNTETPVGTLLDPDHWVVDAYVDERDISRIQPGAHAKFQLKGQWQTLNARVQRIDPTPVRQIPALLDSRFGGALATASGEPAGVPSQALYRVRLTLLEAPQQWRETAGQVQITGQARSLLLDGLKTALAVFIRESGF